MTSHQQPDGGHDKLRWSPASQPGSRGGTPPPDLLTLRRRGDRRVQELTASAPKIAFALGLLSWMRRARQQRYFIREKFARKLKSPRPTRAPGRLELRRNHRDLGTTYEIPPATCRPASTGRSRAHRASSLTVAGRSAVGLPVVLGSYPITWRRTSCTNCPSTRTSMSSPSRPSRGSRHRCAAPLRWCVGSHHIGTVSRSPALIGCDDQPPRWS